MLQVTFPDRGSIEVFFRKFRQMQRLSLKVGEGRVFTCHLCTNKLDHIEKSRIRATNILTSRQETPCLLVTRWFIACSQVASFRELICHYYCASADLTTIMHRMRKLIYFLCILLLSWPATVGSPYITLHYISSR